MNEKTITAYIDAESLDIFRAGSDGTVFVGDDSIRCYCSEDGEIQPVSHVIIDKNSTIYERNAGLTETAELRGKSITLIGCGSLGSIMAVSLALAGVGT